jgi:hypothetical protein
MFTTNQPTNQSSIYTSTWNVADLLTEIQYFSHAKPSKDFTRGFKGKRQLFPCIS